jgi:hypothetical protein
MRVSPTPFNGYFPLELLEVGKRTPIQAQPRNRAFARK